MARDRAILHERHQAKTSGGARGSPSQKSPPKAMPVNAERAANLHRPCTETDQNEIDGDVRKGRTGTEKRGLGLAVPANSGHA